MNSRTRYFPPEISKDWLDVQMLRSYPAHKSSQVGRELLERLTEEYLKFWRLVLSFPDKRVVATAPILAVQRVHQSNRKEYFDDCMAYFNRFLSTEFCWKGRSDVTGTVDTVSAYRELYRAQPPEQWRDIVNEYNLGKPKLIIV
jgi:hypothetical protein